MSHIQSPLSTPTKSTSGLNKESESGYETLSTKATLSKIESPVADKTEETELEEGEYSDSEAECFLELDDFNQLFDADMMQKIKKQAIELLPENEKERSIFKSRMSYRLAFKGEPLVKP